MGTLTKVLALLVSALAIFLCGLVVTFVTNTSNYREAYDQQKAITEAAQIQALVAEEAMARSGARQETLMQSLQNTIVALEQQNSDLLRRWSAEAQGRAEADHKSATAVQVLKSLRETIQNMYTSQQQLQGDLDKAHEEMIAAQSQRIELTRELHRERAKGERLTSLGRLRLEKIQELEDENAEMRQKVRAVTVSPSELRPGEDQVTQVEPRETGVPIRGEVTAVDDKLASISVGASSGVRKDTKFLVVRGGRYLGDLVITHVESTEAAGQLVRQLGTVVKGDSVTTGFD